MNAPLVLGHAGEEVVYVLIPVVVILWLKNIAARRAEREAQEGLGKDDPEAGVKKLD